MCLCAWMLVCVCTRLCVSVCFCVFLCVSVCFCVSVGLVPFPLTGMLRGGAGDGNAQIRPDLGVYNHVLGSCAKLGRAQVAFKIYNKIKKDQRFDPDTFTMAAMFK